MDSGRLKDWIEIQQVSITFDQYNSEIESWTEFDSVWSEFAPTRGAEKVVAAQLREVQTFTVTIRHLPGINTTMRVLFDSDYYDITSIEKSIIRRNEFMLLTCTKGVNDG